MVVCICASIKFVDKIKEIKAELDKLDIPCLLPEMILPNELKVNGIISKLKQNHFDKIDKSDSILVVNPTGYFGDSVKVEIGYAKGANKKVYFLEKTNQIELDCLADDFIFEDGLLKLKD